MEQALNNIIYNYILDLHKKKVSPYERAKVIKLYLDENNFTLSDLRCRIRVKQCILEDWMLWDIPYAEYLEYKKKELSDDYIFQFLKKRSNPNYVKDQAIDIYLRKIIKLFTIYKLGPPHSSKTVELIDEAISSFICIKKIIKKSDKNE